MLQRFEFLLFDRPHHRPHRLIEKGAGHQVGAGGIRGVLGAEACHFADDVPVGLLLPAQLCALLVQTGNLVLIAGDRVFDHALRIHAAGKARNHISISIDTSGTAYAADCHIIQPLSGILVTAQPSRGGVYRS